MASGRCRRKHKAGGQRCVDTFSTCQYSPLASQYACPPRKRSASRCQAHSAGATAHLHTANDALYPLCTPRNRQLTHALYGSRYVYPRLTRTVYEGITWNSSTPCSACRRSTSGCQPQQRRRRGTVLLHMVTTATSKLSGTLPVDWRRTLPGWRCVWCRLIQKMPDNSPNIAARRRLRMDGPDTAGARNGAAARRWPRIRHVDGAASRGWAGCDDGCEYLGTGQVSCIIFHRF